MSTTGLLVVNVQPAYSQWCAPVARQVAKRINNTRKPTVVMWVGKGVTSDSEDDVREYLRANGARPGKLASCAFVEKDHGFFRGWMDNGVSADDIITVGTELLRQGNYSSEDLDLAELFGDNLPDLPEYSNLLRPSFDPRRLSGFTDFETCGGGAHECLAEIELWLAMNKQGFQRLDELVY